MQAPLNWTPCYSILEINVLSYLLLFSYSYNEDLFESTKSVAKQAATFLKLIEATGVCN